MPSPKRWFPVSHDLPTDPDVWDFLDVFGPRALMTWLWILSRIDQGDGVCRIPERELMNISRTLRQNQRSIRQQLAGTHGMVERGWLKIEEVSESGWPEVVSAPKYRKYRRPQDVSASRRPSLTPAYKPPQKDG